MEAKHPLAKAATPAEPQDQQTAPGISQLTHAPGFHTCHPQSCKDGRAHTGGLWRLTSPGSNLEEFDLAEVSGNHSDEEQRALQLRLQ